MTAYLPDTNVFSELLKTRPEPNVLQFFADNSDLWLSVVVRHEMQYGVERMDPGQRRDDLQSDMTQLFAEYEERYLPFDRTCADWAARYRAINHRQGRATGWGDALIAGTARTHGLTVATRNMRDFEVIGVDAINPWDSPLSP
ncbi:MAG: type II toxin-antitoxin system VapC family toxin [Chloroflexi bacterium]|nr:type II toxin-antitoxin system VapC family toxin [Chloroflexota bacterium]